MPLQSGREMQKRTDDTTDQLLQTINDTLPALMLNELVKESEYATVWTPLVH